MSSYAIAAFLTFLSTGLLAIFVLAKGSGRSITRLFAIYTLAISAWSFSWYKFVAAGSYEQSLFWCRFLHYPASFIPATFLHFVQQLLNIEEERKQIYLRRLFYGCGVIFACVAFTPGFVKSVVPKLGFQYYLEPGTSYGAFFIFFVIAIITTHYFLFKSYRSSTGFKRTQIGYVLAAYVLAYLGGTAVFLPVYNLPLPAVALYLIPLSHIIIAFTILTHRLMDISVVVRKTLLYSFISAVLASVYVGAVTLLARLLENQSAVPLLFHTEIFRWFIINLRISFAYSCIATSLFSISFSIFVWVRGPQKAVNRMWALACLSIGTWSLGLGMMVRAPNWSNAYLWERWVQYPGAIMIPIFFFHFVTLVLDVSEKRVLRTGYAVAGLIEIVNALGFLVSLKIQPPFNFFTLALKAYPLFITYFFTLVIYAHILLVRKLFKAEGRMRNQIKYICLGTSIGFCGGMTSFFPVYNIPIFPYGVYAVPLYIVTVSYAIFKHQLMDINVVIRKTLVYSLLSAALAAVYVGTITLLAQVLGGRHGPASAASSALAAIFITLLFNPVRVRIQRFVDRYFSRESVDETVLREITGAFVHEIKTPLSNIVLPAELTFMDMEDLESNKKSVQDVIPKIRKRMKYIMDQAMLASRRVEAVGEVTGREKAVRDPVNLAEVVKRTLNQAETMVGQSRADIQVQIPEHLPLLLGDAGQLEIVFVNLLKNAIDALSELSQEKVRVIQILARTQSGHVVIDISDTGPGVKPEDTERIFESHYTTKGARGAGMGLSLVKQIIHAHAGSIELISKYGNGATFQIHLPSL